ncbi:MAG: hypothetical protein SGI87_09055 [Flavobacteriales bacterium]|nr:hypothetical protein [Flavobacteriales bacterium]
MNAITINKALVRESDKETYKTSKTIFPGWKLLIDYVNDSFEGEVLEGNHSIQASTHQCIKTIDRMRKKLSKEGEFLLPELAHQWVKNASGRYHKGSDMRSVLDAMRAIEMGNTEFFSIYDVLKNEHVLVDDRVEKILGIPKHKFNIRALSGHDESFPLHHPEDIHHFVRLATIAYMVSCLPGFEWRANQDYFRANLRLGTSCSSIETLQQAEYVMAELRIYMSHERIDGEEFLPVFHLDRWTIYDASEFDGIKPYFSSGMKQSQYMNAYQYLLHAYLLDVSPKYVLMMHERVKHDRHKAIAKAISDQVFVNTGKEIELDESRVANYFSKTIRPKMGSLLHLWDRSKKLHTPESDIQAVEIAKRMGLLPIPPLILEKLYEHIIPSR